MNWINLHSHHELPSNESGLVNLKDLNLLPSKANLDYSSGIHPWDCSYLDRTKQLEQLKRQLSHPSVKAIGECGLDRICKIDFNLQKEVFSEQIRLAEKLQLPLILHAVRSYSDMAQLKKQLKSSVPWVLHGYQGTIEQSIQLSRLGFYFSFGPRLLKNLPKLNKSLQAIPSDQLFFETDNSNEKIESIYIFAGSVLRIDPEILNQKINSNYRAIVKTKN